MTPLSIVKSELSFPIVCLLKPTQRKMLLVGKCSACFRSTLLALFLFKSLLISLPKCFYKFFSTLDDSTPLIPPLALSSSTRKSLDTFGSVRLFLARPVLFFSEHSTDRSAQLVELAEITSSLRIYLHNLFSISYFCANAKAFQTFFSYPFCFIYFHKLSVLCADHARFKGRLCRETAAKKLLPDATSNSHFDCHLN